MFTKEFWKDTIERTIGTMAEVAIPLIPVQGMVSGFDIRHFAAVVVGSGVCCILKCIVTATKKEA